jgi:hypothetical protein
MPRRAPDLLAELIAELIGGLIDCLTGRIDRLRPGNSRFL